MTAHKMALEGELKITGGVSVGTVERSAETWQFFAFMFAAVVTFVFEVLGDIEMGWAWKQGLRLLIFIMAGYFILWNRTCRNLQVQLLSRFKKEIYS